MAFERTKATLSNASFAWHLTVQSVRPYGKNPCQSGAANSQRRTPALCSQLGQDTWNTKPRPIRCGSRFCACLHCWLLSLPSSWNSACQRKRESCRPMQQMASRLPSTLHIYFALEKRFSSSVLEWQPLPPSQLHPGPAGQLPKIKVSAAPGQSLGGVSI